MHALATGGRYLALYWCTSRCSTATRLLVGSPTLAGCCHHFELLTWKGRLDMLLFSMMAACITPVALPHVPRSYLCGAGRLMHHLKEVEGMSLRTVEFCVFDEADRLFEMGFAAQLREILSKMGSQRQVGMCKLLTVRTGPPRQQCLK